MSWLAAFIDSTAFGSVPLFLLACLTLLVAEAIYVLFGFGAGLIAVGVLAMVLPEVTDVVVMLLLVNLPLELAIVFRSRAEVSWRDVLLICAGIAVGVPAGTMALQWANAPFVLVLLGIFLLLAGALFLVLPARTRPVRWPGWSIPLWGALAGVLAGLFGTGGPPLILHYRLAATRKAAFRGNLMAIFLVIALVRLPAYGAAGLITTDRLLGAGLVFPAALLGGLLGRRFHLEIEEHTFQRLVAAALLLIGVLLVAR